MGGPAIPITLKKLGRRSLAGSHSTGGRDLLTMSAKLIQCLFLTVWFVHLDCEVYQDRPKIKTSGGDLILEAAQDKNIYLLPNGPKSRVLIGSIDLLAINASSSPRGEPHWSPAGNEVDQYITGPSGILRRLENLEYRDNASPSIVQANVTILWRKINRINNRLLSLESQISSMTTDACQSNPCKHGSTCLTLVNGYHCLCPSNWEGTDCDVDVNECRNFAGTDLGCQNGASCINKPGAYECQCKFGWFGLHCTRKLMDCSGGNFEMCGHGTCVPVTSGVGITCICNQGWTNNGTGPMCLTDINECDSSQGLHCSVNPRVECINTPGSFRCGHCPLGYEGDGFVCSDIDECLTIPNGGCSPMVTCHNTIGSRICGSCPPGYQGDGVTCTWRGTCSINRGGCHPAAQCIDNLALGGQTSQCVCPNDMAGDGVGLHGCYVPSGGNTTQRCEGNPCVHGQCHTLRLGYTCICSIGYSGAHCDRPADYCANNPCLNGGICRPDRTLQKGFRCECTAQYTGDICDTPVKICGGILDNEEGSLYYPLHNSSYTHDSKCAWVIHTVPEKVINVTFSKFNLEYQPECSYDFLQIHDGRTSASQLINRFCGNQFPNGGNIISSHNYLYFWFRSDSSVAKDGFALHWNSIPPVCGGEVDATVHGRISSPGSPGKYPPNRDCYWNLQTNLGKKIQLHFFELDIEAHSNCSYDYISIFDGEHNTDPLINQYCNSTLPSPVLSAGSHMLIHFHSDAYGAGNGFQISYAPVQGTPGCGGFFTSDRGEIVSPSFNGKSLHNLQCDYKIQTGKDTKIRITFVSFALEHSLHCKFDYLKLYDGPSADSRVYGPYCGTRYPHSPFISSSNSIIIKFHTDYNIASEGFKITYEAVCQHTIMGDSGVIKSPGYPFNYPPNQVCEYIISTAPGKSIQLTFQDFDIEDNRYYDCRYDNVEIMDGPDINSTSLGRFCGGSEHMPPTKTSTHNYMYVRFKSDLSVTGTGFYANYTTINTECGGIYRQTSGLINHPSTTGNTYNNDQNCIWLLIAPVGFVIKLTWNRFDLEAMSSCQSDYLELVEIDDNNQHSALKRYCGSTLPPAVTISTNRLMLRFHSDSSIRSSGFSVLYSFLDAKLHCGGTFIKTHGFIYSPGWPELYDRNRDCIWTISVPVGQQIALNISQFDLERPTRGNCDHGDYLEIRNGATENSPSIGKYCGSFKSRLIKSLGNSIYIHFYSDMYLSGRGFKIEWDGTISGCGGTLSSASGSISSPNYPQNYHDNAECFYKIVTSSGSRIQITFTDLDLEETRNCRDDYIEIFDGRTQSDPSLGRDCKMSPALTRKITTSNYALIKFRSDILIGAKGFYLNYQTICNNNLTGSYGIIESPSFPGNYPNHLNCLWTINVPKGHKINVTYTDFDIYRTEIRRYASRPPGYSYGFFSSAWRVVTTTTNCDQDFLQMRQTPDINFSEKLCGTSKPPAFSSKSNSLQIKFIASSAMPHNGFRLEWVRHGCGGTIQKRYGSLSVGASDDEMECEWVIEAPVGKSIFITFTEIYLTETKNCTSDAIEIYSGPTTNFPLILPLCQRQSASLHSNTNTMLVRYVKKSNLKGAYFKSNFDSYRTGCGGRMDALTGLIHSKNYPKNYDSNMDCIWYITVPKYHRIEMNFLDVDLYSSNEGIRDEDCRDVIKIFETSIGFIMSKNYSQLICPRSTITQFVSKSNRIALQFVSDASGSAKGFKANFTITCGAVIMADADGTITNDKFPSHSNQSCTWTLLAPKLDQKITLTITHISIPKNYDIATNRNCPSSYLRVLEGNDENGPQIGEYCGNKVPPMIVSQGSALTIQLGTYTNNITGQFSAHYTTMSNACGGTFTSEEGTIASPNYPLAYPVNSDCEYTLSTSPGNRVYVLFETLDLAYSDGCNEDYIELRENNGAGPLLDVYCNNKKPTNTTKASKIYIKFHSDNKNAGKGFLLHYGFLHGNEITGLEKGEISSPLYPSSYGGTGEYTWRIMTTGTKPISLVLDKLVIHTYGSECSNYLAIYDGYDDTAPLLQELLCGMLNAGPKEFRTSENVVYIKLKLDSSNTGSLFHIRWSKLNIIEEESNESGQINCGSNQTQLLLPGEKGNATSPNYPNTYRDDLNCEWVFKTLPGRQLSIDFPDFHLEERKNCFADYISIYSSKTGLQWKPIKEYVCKSESARNIQVDTAFMKLYFKTDYSVVEKGFRAQITSKCGGLFTDSSGKVELMRQDEQDHDFGLSVNSCKWTIKVRPGRVIKLQFEQFNITNKADDCNKFVTLRNGGSAEAPFLGNGKYCGYDHENRDNEMETSSNLLFVTFERTRYQTEFQNFRLRYEEKNIECGVTSKLDAAHNWEIISTPNYPNIPIPYSECIWVFSGPVGEILRVDFERFDLKYDDDCKREFLEIRDGQSSLSPLKGQFCNEKPGSIKSSSNGLYLKYVTQIEIPNVGFKANVSIDVCGGTIISNNGELTSPGYPRLPMLSPGTVCEWRITGSPGHIVLLKPQDIQLPESESPCATKIIIEDLKEVNKTLKTYCNEEIEDLYAPIESSSSEVLIKLYVGKRSYRTHFSEKKGFRFTFESSIPMCGGRLTTPEGYLMTPGYPRPTSLHCYWLITVPNTSRRIRLEIEDSDLDTDTHRIGIYNDNNFRNLIQTMSNKDYNPANKIFESSGNKLGIYIWLSPSSSQHRFKAKFSSNEPALCGGTLNGISGELTSPALEQSYSCDWSYRGIIENGNQNDDDYNIEYNSIFVNAKVNSSLNRTRCRYADPKLEINGALKDNRFDRELCGNTEVQIRIPSNAMYLKAVQNTATSLYFHLDWKLQPCGGIVRVGEGSINVINVPNYYNDTLDCAWIIKTSPGNRLNITLDGTFKLSCPDEFIQISHGSSQNYPVIGDYCTDKRQDKALILSFGEIYVQYHSNKKNETSVKLIAQIVNHQCGGYLSRFDRTFTSPNYPKTYIENQECSWEIETDLGNRVSLNFVDRFVIEDTRNCTKDAIIIYDWVDDEYIQLKRLCGRSPPPPINSTYNRMKVVLRTDSKNNLDGFKASWRPICGGKFTAKESAQILSSPGYPGVYMPSLDCIYEITAPGQKIALKFLEFELEGTYPDCFYDNVYVYAGTYDYGSNPFCGSEIPSPVRFGDSVSIRFRTDTYIQKKGFKLSYSLNLCGGNVDKPTVITSGEGLRYDRDINCTWQIEAPNNKVVVVKFISMHIEGRSCNFDYVELFNGLLLNNDNRIVKTCGLLGSDSSVFRSTGNKMLMHFVTDSSVSYEGFRAEVFFSYSESVGCGGHFELTETSSININSPLIGNSTVYENYLDCHWTIRAPSDRVIKLEFLNFHIASCQDVNQTSIGYTKCDCDYVEIKDGINPDSLKINSYCGHTMPPPLTSSSNLMSIRLSTNGEINSSGFKAKLSALAAPCGQTTYTISDTKQVVRSPGYLAGSIPRGLHCVYEFIQPRNTYVSIHVRINHLDIQPGDTDKNQCTSDKLIISGLTMPRNQTLGRNYVHNHGSSQLFDTPYIFEDALNLPKHVQLCGIPSSHDYFFYGSTTLEIITSPNTDLKPHKGFELEVINVGACGRNYTEPQARIQTSSYGSSDDDIKKSCFTLITAPVNYTISLYFISVSTIYWNEQVYLEVFDGDKTSAPKLIRITDDNDVNAPVFSTGRYLLLHSHQVLGDLVTYDLNYLITNKGRGCGGKLQNEYGLVTSPMYPTAYRQVNTCAWELETPVGTKLRLHFSTFDLGAACTENYVKLVKRNGDAISTFCNEDPADYTSEDNYIKIVFATNFNNGGTGWVAHFIGVI